MMIWYGHVWRQELCVSLVGYTVCRCQQLWELDEYIIANVKAWFKSDMAVVVLFVLCLRILGVRVCDLP